MSQAQAATLGTNSFLETKDDLIIEQPGLKSLKHRYGQKTLALIGWIGWLYLLLPLVNLAGWAFGIQMFYYKIIIDSDKVQLIALIVAYVVLITVVINMIAGWALYHIWRFAGKERRKAQPETTIDDLADYFNVTAYRIPSWQQAKSMTLHLNDNGQLEHVEPIASEVRQAAQRFQ